MSGLDRQDIGDAPQLGRTALRALLLLAGPPLAFLTALSLRYALTDPACAGTAGRVALELATLIGVLAAALALRHGWRRLTQGGFGHVTDARLDSGRFVAMSAAMTGALFLLASVALWLPSLFLSPCAWR